MHVFAKWQSPRSHPLIQLTGQYPLDKCLQKCKQQGGCQLDNRSPESGTVLGRQLHAEELSEGLEALSLLLDINDLLLHIDDELLC